MRDELFGTLLIKQAYCNEETIKRALEIQRGYGGKIGTILLNMGAITEDQLLLTLAEQLQISFIQTIEDITPLHLPLDPRFLKEHQIVPFRQQETTLDILTTTPLNSTAFALIETVTGKNVVPHLVREEQLKQLLLQMLSEEIIESELIGDIEAEDEIDKLKELASEAPVIKLVNALLTKAVDTDASDIHFESLRNLMKVRFRIDGILHTVEVISPNIRLAVITRLKLVSGMNIAEHRIPQDGRISLRIAGKELDIRASSVPTQFGESFVLRLLGKENIDYSLSSLGLFQDHIDLIHEITARTNGIFLTTGPTGSGKTTTLYAVLSRLNSDKVKIITAENPVEYELKGVSQINIRSDIDYTFANALRSILRQDPDIIMVGEIRDQETAEIAVQSSLTGHLVVSTLHTNNALSSITRLLDMGIEFFLLKSTIIGVMAQRLVRRLCPHCARLTAISPDLEQAYGIAALLEHHPWIVPQPRQAVGCPACNNTGYRGRTVIAEVAPFDRSVQEHFEQDRSFCTMEKLGYRSLLQDGILKWVAGHTSLEEVIRVAG